MKGGGVTREGESADMTEEIEVYYLDEKKEEQKGVFKVRRLLADEASNLYEICQKKNPRTGQPLGSDTTKFSKYKVAMMIVDCPITSTDVPTGKTLKWTDMDPSTKAGLIGQRLEEDMFVRLINKGEAMRRFKEEDANL